MKKKNQNPSIKSQFFTAHILLVLISTISFFVLSSVFLYAQNVKNVDQNLRHTQELSALHTNSFFQQLENTAYHLSVNTDIPQILSSKEECDAFTKQRNRSTINNTWLILQAALSSPVDFTLYTTSDNPNIYFDHTTFCTYESIQNEPWYTPLMTSKNKMIYFVSPKDSEKVSLISKIYELNNYDNPVCIMRLTVEASILGNILGGSSMPQETFNILIDKNKNYISTYIDFSLTEEDINSITLGKTGQKRNSIRLSNGCRYFVRSQTLDNRSLSLYTLSCVDSIYGTIFVMLVLLLAILVLISFVAFLISWRRSTPLINAFNTLSGAMRKMSLGEFKQLHIPENMDNNIVETYNAYNHLMDSMTSLIQYNDSYESKLKHMELNFLQQQIKPHFLYNTLNTIQGLIKGDDKNKALELIHSLSKFYRFSLHNSDDMVDFSTEITHITHYIKVENFKFNNAIQLNIDIPEDIMQCKVPKLILQPIIENAVHHGIREKETGTGTISISHKCENGDVFIYVTDDGVGIPEKKLKAIRHGHSIGFLNTDKRIRLFYGDDYGLEIESVEGQYTKVTIKIKGESE